MKNPTDVRIGKELTIRGSETTVFSSLNDEPDTISGCQVQLDLGVCNNIEVGAGWRLGNALRRYAGRLEVKLPPLVDEKKFYGWWFLNYTRSGLGFSLAKYAHRITAGDKDITDAIKEYYAKPRSVVRIPYLAADLWAAQNFCLITGIHEGLLDPNKKDLFDEAVGNLLPLVQIGDSGYSQRLGPVFQFLFEAVQNSYDHATRKPYPPNTPILSYLSLRYYKTIFSPTPFNQTTFPDYIARLKKLPDAKSFQGFVEIVVNDDGVGISARYTLDNDIYWQKGRKEEEKTSLVAALETGGSVKLRALDSPVRGDPGYGFDKITEGLRQVHAYGLLRTGRMEAFFDSTSEMKVFRLGPPLPGCMPGTTLQVIFPVKLHDDQT